MWQVNKSALFKEQWLEIAIYYKTSTSEKVALNFIDNVENALDFIGREPLACSIYQPEKDYKDLAKYNIRIWSLKNFPHSMFFRVIEDKIMIDAIYAHKMNIGQWLKSDI